MASNNQQAIAPFFKATVAATQLKAFKTPFSHFTRIHVKILKKNKDFKRVFDSVEQKKKQIYSKNLATLNKILDEVIAKHLKSNNGQFSDSKIYEELRNKLTPNIISMTNSEDDLNIEEIRTKLEKLTLSELENIKNENQSPSLENVQRSSSSLSLMQIENDETQYLDKSLSIEVETMDEKTICNEAETANSNSKLSLINNDDQIPRTEYLEEDEPSSIDEDSFNETETTSILPNNQNQFPSTATTNSMVINKRPRTEYLEEDDEPDSIDDDSTFNGIETTNISQIDKTQFLVTSKSAISMKRGKSLKKDIVSTAIEEKKNEFNFVKEKDKVSARKIDFELFTLTCKLCAIDEKKETILQTRSRQKDPKLQSTDTCQILANLSISQCKQCLFAVQSGNGKITYETIAFDDQLFREISQHIDCFVNKARTLTRDDISKIAT